MKNFLVIQFVLLFLCVYVIGYSGVVNGDVHRIIIKEDFRRPKRHNKPKHHRSHKHKHHQHRDEDDDFKRNKFRDSNHSLEGYGSFYDSHENSYEGRHKHKDHSSHNPFRSHHHHSNSEKRNKRQKHHHQFQHQQWTPLESLESSSSNRYNHNFFDTHYNSFSPIDNSPYRRATQKKIDLNQTFAVTTTTKPSAYEVYENSNSAGKIVNQTYQVLPLQNGMTGLTQNYQLLSPLFHFDNQLSAVNNMTDTVKPPKVSTTRKRRVMVRRRKVDKTEKA